MQKKLLPIALSLLLACQLLIPSITHASWGAARLQELQNQNKTITNPGTNPPPVVNPPSDDTQTPDLDNMSVADRIRYLRAQKLQGGNQVPQNPTPNNPGVPTQPTPPTTPGTPPASDGRVLSSEAAKMVSLVNQERAKHGLKPLTVHAGLTELAQVKSLDMLNNNYFSHTSPTYGSFANMVYNHGISFRSVGENLAQARSTTHAHGLLMASEGHRNNILNPNFTHIGIGVVQGPYGVYVTQLFIMQ